MRYAGLSWRRIPKGTAEEEIYRAIADSVDRGCPVLMKLGDGPDWHVVAGYEDGAFYGLDSHEHYDASVHPVVQPDRYTEDGLFVLSKWFDSFEDAILIAGRAEPSLSLHEILATIIAVLEHPTHARLRADLNRKIDEITPENAQQTALWLNEVAGFPIEARWHAAECFTSGEAADFGMMRLTGDPAVRQLLGRLFERYIANGKDETHGVLWKVWAQLGVGPDTGYAVPPNAGELVMRPEARAELKRLFALVFENDRAVLAALKEAAALLQS